MNKCKFCGINDLDNTGAHIFTDAIIRSALYIDGKSRRGDYEAIAEISLDKIDFDYFGASVLPEKREEILGNEQSEEDIEQTSDHPFINRQLVCRACEKLFGPVENYFVENIYAVITDSSKINSELHSKPYFEFGEFEYWVTKLMVLINVWRASASKYNDWSLSAGDEELIRSFLEIGLVFNDIREIVKKAQTHQNAVAKFDFSVLTVDQTSGKPSENLILIDHPDDPYVLFINRIIVLFSVDNFASLSISRIFGDTVSEVGLREEVNRKPQLLVKHLTNDQRLALLNAYFMRQWGEIVKHGHKTFAELFSQFTGYFPTNDHHLLLDYNIRMAIQSGAKASPNLIINVSAQTLAAIFGIE